MAAQVALRRQQVVIKKTNKIEIKNSQFLMNQAQEENEARELSILYGCHDGLLAMHRAGLTFSAAMSQMIQVNYSKVDN